MKLTEKKIKSALLHGSVTGLPLMCILHEVRRNTITGDFMNGWVAVTDPQESGCVEITREQARGLIDMLGLLPVHSNSNGTVYDTASCRWRTAHLGEEPFRDEKPTRRKTRATYAA